MEKQEGAWSVIFYCGKRFISILCRSKCTVAEYEIHMAYYESSHGWILVRLSRWGPGTTTLAFHDLGQLT